MRKRGTAWHEVRGFTFTAVLLAAAGCARDVAPRHREPVSEDGDGPGMMPTEQDASSPGDEDVHAQDDGSTDDGPSDDDPGVDDGDDFAHEQACRQADEEFTAFVAEHRSCQRDEDCTIVGDCGSNADFTAVRADVAEQAYALMLARCLGTYDGPIHGATCQAGTCVLSQKEIGCCGCPIEVDAGAF